MMLKKYAIQGVLSFFLIAMLHCSGKAQTKQLVIQGSSTAACTGPSDFNHCWVHLLEVYYNQQKPTIVNNFTAQGGYNPYHGMPDSYIPPPGRPSRDPNKNITKSLTANPDVIIVNYPSNEYNNYSVTEVMAALRLIYDSATRFGKPCYITTPQPRSSAGYDNSFTKRNMADIKDSVLQQFGYFALNFWDGLVNLTDTTILPQYNSGDNIHLNDAGHAFITNVVIAKDIFNVALPLYSLKFTATLKDKKVQLKWWYNDDVKITSWQLQKSTNGINYNTFFETSGIGKKQFECIDKHPNTGSNFYRLQFTLADGTKEYSPIKKITVAEKQLAVLQKRFTLNNLWLRIYSPIPQTASLQLMNTNGIEINTQQLYLRSGENETNLPINGLQNNALVIMRLQTAGQNIVQKLSLR